MNSDLVTIAHEFNPLKANLMRTRLEADGIECFLKGETLTGVVGSLSYASASWEHPEGNITLQVRGFEAERAREIIRAIEDAPREEDEGEDWVDNHPSFAVRFFRVLIIGSWSLSAAISVSALTQNWWLGGLAGAITLTICYFLSVKKISQP